MNQKHCLLVMAFAGVLSLAPLPAFSGNLSNFSDALEQLADMTRAADRAHDALNDAMQGGRDYSRYDRDWRNAESRLERARIRTMAHIAGVRLQLGAHCPEIQGRSASVRIRAVSLRSRSG